jgi:hypothetical protein
VGEVLGGFITDLIVNRRGRRVPEEEIRRVVVETIRAAGIGDAPVGEIRRQVMRELEQVLAELTSVKQGRRGVYLSAEIRHGDRVALQDLLAELAQVIAERRRSLGLVIPAEIHERPLQERPFRERPRLVQVPQAEVEPYWRQRITQTGQLIEEWRSGQRPPPGKPN